MTRKSFNRVRAIFSILSIGCLLFIIFEGPIGPYLVQATTFGQSVRRWTGSLDAHTPIRITSNANFTASNGVTGGSGTPASPWIIEDWMIFAEGIGSGILIANTTDHFIIRQCSLWGAAEWYCGNGVCNEWYNLYNVERGDAGIVLMNVTNARLENNNCYSNGYCGIYVENSSSSILQENWCWDNHGFGIVLHESLNNTILNNNCTNDETGIRVNECRSCLVQGNTVWNTYEGIMLNGSVSNIVTNNIIQNCKDGLNLETSSGNLLELNVLRNVWFGIFFCCASGNIIQQNVFDRTDTVFIQSCWPNSSNSIVNNEISFNSPTIFGSFSFSHHVVGDHHNWYEDYSLTL